VQILFQQSKKGAHFNAFRGLVFARRQVVLTVLRGLLYKFTFLGVYESHPIALPAADRETANGICQAGSPLHVL
jgi:hypothetical protein